MPSAEEKAQQMKAKLEQERLDEEQRQTTDAAERKRIAEEVAQKKKDGEEAAALDAAAAAKTQAELEATEKAATEASSVAAAEAKQKEEEEKAAKRQAALELAEKEEEERATRIADLAAKQQAAKAATPKKVAEPKKQRPKQEMAMAGMEDRLERQMSRTPALKSLLKWLQKSLQEAFKLENLKDGIIAKATDFDIAKTAKALDTILVENPGNGLARIALGILCYSGCATSTTLPKSSVSFVGSLFAIRLFYEFVAWREDNNDDADPTGFTLSVENIAANDDEEEVAAGFGAADAFRDSAKAFVLMLIKAYTTSGNPREENPNGVSYAYLGDPATTCDIIMGKFSTLQAIHTDTTAKVQAALGAAAAKVSPNNSSAEQTAYEEAQTEVQELKDRLAGAQKELALADTRQQKAKTEAEAQSKKQGAAKADLKALLTDKKRIQAFFAAADSDGDGMLSLAEAKAQGMDEATFHEIDADGNGQLTKEEFAQWQERGGGPAKQTAGTTALGAALGAAGKTGADSNNSNNSDDDSSDFASSSDDDSDFGIAKEDDEEEATGFATSEHAF